MSTTSELPKGFFPVQTRVSKGRNPELYAHLSQETQNGESPGAVLRRLAEEALLLRNHPLMRVLQAVDFKVDSRPMLHTTPQAGTEQRSETLHTSATPVSKQAPPKEAPKPVPAAPANGAQRMAAALVSRAPAAAAPRG